MMKLIFPLPPALELAEHAAAAAGHLPSPAELDRGLPARPSLVWVKDDGTYLMSNGTPRLLRDPQDPTSNVVVGAEGWGPGSEQDLGRIAELGGDDFCEYIDLTGPLGRFATLLQAMRTTAKAGFAWLVITAHDDTSYSLALVRRSGI